jgi:hypothetical protein
VLDFRKCKFLRIMWSRPATYFVHLSHPHTNTNKRCEHVTTNESENKHRKNSKRRWFKFSVNLSNVAFFYSFSLRNSSTRFLPSFFIQLRFNFFSVYALTVYNIIVATTNNNIYTEIAETNLSVTWEQKTD